MSPFPLFLWPVIQLIHWPWRERAFLFPGITAGALAPSLQWGWIHGSGLDSCWAPASCSAGHKGNVIHQAWPQLCEEEPYPTKMEHPCCARLPGIAVPTRHFGERDLKLTKIISLQEIAPWPGHETHQQESETERLKLTQLWDSAECTNTGLTTACRTSSTTGNLWPNSSLTAGGTPAVTKRLLKALSSSSCLYEAQWPTLTITSDHLIEAEEGDGMGTALSWCCISSKALCCTAAEAHRPPQGVCEINTCKFKQTKIKTHWRAAQEQKVCTVPNRAVKMWDLHPSAVQAHTSLTAVPWFQPVLQPCSPTAALHWTAVENGGGWSDVPGEGQADLTPLPAAKCSVGSAVITQNRGTVCASSKRQSLLEIHQGTAWGSDFLQEPPREMPAPCPAVPAPFPLPQHSSCLLMLVTAWEHKHRAWPSKEHRQGLGGREERSCINLPNPPHVAVTYCSRHKGSLPGRGEGLQGSPCASRVSLDQTLPWSHLHFSSRDTSSPWRAACPR